VFEIDRPGPQAWKRQRLIELGFGVPDWLRFEPRETRLKEPGIERRQSALRSLAYLRVGFGERLVSAGFDDRKPAIVVSTGVSMYLSKDANAATLRAVASLAPGSTLAMTFLLPLELADAEVRPGLEMAAKGARAGGTPFVSFFTPPEILALARDLGFREARHVTGADLTERYVAGRSDGLRPPRNAGELLVALT
jgi:O-methyltransferase involved in polyketide biosynthesis